MKLKELLEKQEQKGLYAAVKFSEETVERFLNFCKTAKIPNTLKADDFHSTLCYSRKPVPDFKPAKHLEEVGKPTSFEIWDSEPNAFKKEKTKCLVLKFESEYLHSRFNEIMTMGATYDYDEYKPHITFSYDVGEKFTLKNLPPPTSIGTIDIISEYSEELNLNESF